MNCEVKSFNLDRAILFGYKPTKTQRIIRLRSRPHVHSEFVYSSRYGGLSFSATMEDGCKCCRFKDIQYSHPEYWDKIIIPMTDEQEDWAWGVACKMANVPFDWYCRNCTTTSKCFYGPDAIKYDFKGQICHVSKWNIIKPDPNKTWCSKAVNQLVCLDHKDFYILLKRLGIVTELTPEELEYMARYYFRKAR